MKEGMIIDGKKLRQRREHLGMSQVQVAAGICHQSMISRMEQKNHVTSMTLLHKVCRRLEMNLGTLVKLDDINQMPLAGVRDLIDSNQLIRASLYIDSKKFYQRLPTFAMAEYYFLKGRLAIMFGNLERGRQNIMWALTEASHTQSALLMEIYAEMALIWQMERRFDEAAECFEKGGKILGSITYKERDATNQVLVRIYRYQAEFAILRDDPEMALRYIRQALKLFPLPNMYYEMVVLQTLRLQCATELHLKTERQDALMLAYAAAKFSNEQQLEDTASAYGNLMLGEEDS